MRMQSREFDYQLAREQGRSLASLSTMIERNAACLNHFVNRGKSRRLTEG